MIGFVCERFVRLLFKRYWILLLLFFLLIMGDTVSSHGSDDFPIKFEEKELRERLTPEQYGITQNHATEKAFTGIYWDHKQPGIYRCVVCNQELFSSSTKFNSGSGWPSFYDVIKRGTVKELVDTSVGMRRTEIVCSKCGAHLGHLFDDGPPPTKKRYCMNSASLQFQERKSVSKQDL